VSYLISGYTRVRVTLTQSGVDMLNQRDADICGRLRKDSELARDIGRRINGRRAGDSYYTDVWGLMTAFGPHVHIGCFVPFQEIEVDPPKADHVTALKRRMYKVHT
jgi:hypothetical protein